MNLTRYNVSESLYIDEVQVYVLPKADEKFSLDVDFSIDGLITLTTSSLILKGKGVGYENDKKTDGIAFEGPLKQMKAVYSLNNF